MTCLAGVSNFLSSCRTYVWDGLCSLASVFQGTLGKILRIASAFFESMWHQNQGQKSPGLHGRLCLLNPSSTGQASLPRLDKVISSASLKGNPENSMPERFLSFLSRKIMAKALRILVPQYRQSLTSKPSEECFSRTPRNTESVLKTKIDKRSNEECLKDPHAIYAQLNQAIDQREREAVKQLMDQDLNDDGTKLIHGIASSGDVLMMKKVLGFLGDDKKTFLQVKDKTGQGAFEYAKENCCFEMMEYFAGIGYFSETPIIASKVVEVLSWVPLAKSIQNLTALSQKGVKVDFSAFQGGSLEVLD